MFRKLSKVSARSIVLWALFSLDVMILTGALLSSHEELWLLSAVLSLGILSLFAAWKEEECQNLNDEDE
ncbi:hypothetical protein [Taibaiella soli]|uniref:Uncharacterized protein n=1 Tax=Taibaiella soli TaxID=1649169 RepID=A0A2W2C2T0_9BACT|nr:hypothetical protein [Taibaiella soli]PZF74413.1 hypothetical protein DN068_02205 [Taibaiella soli]